MEKLQISYANGTIIQNLLAFLDFWKFLENSVASNSYFTERSRCVPLNIIFRWRVLTKVMFGRRK